MQPAMGNRRGVGLGGGGYGGHGCVQGFWEKYREVFRASGTETEGEERGRMGEYRHRAK